MARNPGTHQGRSARKSFFTERTRCHAFRRLPAISRESASRLLRYRPVMAAGSTMRSKSAPLMYPEASAASRRVMPWSLAWGGLVVADHRGQPSRERRRQDVNPGRAQRRSHSSRDPGVRCQISRPGLVALTWAGLIDWQTIELPVAVQVRPRSYSKGFCQYVSSDDSRPVAGPSSCIRADAHCGVLDALAPAEDVSDRIAGKDLRTGWIDWQRADLSGTGHRGADRVFRLGRCPNAYSCIAWHISIEA